MCAVFFAGMIWVKGFMKKSVQYAVWTIIYLIEF